MRLFAARMGLIVAVGVTLRVLYTTLVAPWPPPVGDDALFFHGEANLIAAGHGFISPGLAAFGIFRPSAAHPPLYSLVLAGVAWLGGTGQEIERLAGTVFGAGTIVAVGLLGRRLGGERWGLLAAAIAAVYPMLITADGALLSESLYGMLIAFSLLLAYRLLDAPTPGRAAALGAGLGLTALTRGEALIWLVFLVIPLLRRPGARQAALVTVLATAAILAPWTVRNWIVFHEPVAISTDLASAVGGANCASTWYGDRVGSWDNACVTRFRGNEVTAFDNAESAGISYAEHHVSRAPFVVLARLARVWGLRRNLLPGSKLPQLVDRNAIALEAGFVVYYALVVASIYGWVVMRRRRMPTWPLVSLFVMVTITAVLVYGDVRFREPAEIALVVMSAGALDEMWTRRRRYSSVGGQGGVETVDDRV